MKKTIKTLLMLCIVLFGLVSCVTPGDQPGDEPGTETCEHTTVGNWRAGDTEHWHICDNCSEKYDVAEHSFSDWNIMQEPAVGTPGRKVKTCSVCRYYIAEEIPAIEVVTGETTGDTMVFAQLPADWTEPNIYYWHNEAGTNNLPAENAVSWPGKPMTLVDADANIWGFVVPVGTANVIFNNNGVQTVDIPFAMEANLYILSDAAGGDGKFTANVGSYEFNGSMSDLNKYPTNAPVTNVTVYFKVNTAYPAQYIYFWGSTTPSAGWPGAAMTAVDAANGVYSFDLPSDFGGLVISDGTGDGGDQTNDILPVEGANAYIITAADGKDTVVPATYADGVFTPVEVEATVPVYLLRGDMNGWDTSTALTYDEATDTATLTFTVVAGQAFKFAEASWNNATTISAQNCTFDAAHFVSAGDPDHNIKALVDGTYVVTIVNVSSDSRTCTITLAE